MVELHQNGQVFGEFPFGRHKYHGCGGEFNRKRADRVGYHVGGPSKEDYEQCAEHQGPDTCEWV